MSVHALTFLVTASILRKVATNRQFVLIVSMQIVTGFSSCASLFYPVNTNKFFALLLINVILQTLTHGSQVIYARNDCAWDLGSHVGLHASTIYVELWVHFNLYN